MAVFISDSIIGTFLYIAEGHVKWYNITRLQYGNIYQKLEIIFMTYEPIIFHFKLYLQEIIRDVHKNA